MDLYEKWLGIPEGQRPPDHYELLRCKRFEDDIDKIRAHYKKLNTHVRKYATGAFSIQSQEMLNELAKAMLCLTDSGRKREYDEGLGREFPPNYDAFGRLPLLDVLVNRNTISRSQKKEIEEFADKRGLTHRDAAVQMKVADPQQAAQALAQQLGYSYLDLEDMLPEDSILDRVPRSLVKKYSFLPLFIDDDRLLVATVDELDHELEDELRLRYEVPIRPVIAAPRAIEQALTKYYAPGARDESVAAAAMKPKGKGKAASTNKAAMATKSEPVDPETEAAERQQRGILIMCASVVLPVMPPTLMMSIESLKPYVLAYSLDKMRWLVLLTAPATIAWVMLVYWKKKASS